MKLYHGTYTDFDVIDLSKSNKGKDFGKGFYLSDNYEQAQSFLHFDEYSKEWAEFVLKNRTNDSDNNIHFFDVIYGPIANDKVGVQIRNLMEQNIDMNVFLERLKYMHGITFQYFFGTEKAISKLVRI